MNLKFMVDWWIDGVLRSYASHSYDVYTPLKLILGDGYWKNPMITFS